MTQPTKSERLVLKTRLVRVVTFNGSVDLPNNFLGQFGKHIFSAAYSTQNGIYFEDIPQLTLPTEPTPSKKNNRWYLSYAFGQSLWRDTVDSE
jgi:hypothetical protein